MDDVLSKAITSEGLLGDHAMVQMSCADTCRYNNHNYISSQDNVAEVVFNLCADKNIGRSCNKQDLHLQYFATRH